MLKFILKRIGYGFLVMFGIVIAVFFMSRILPGDPINLMAGTNTSIAQRQIIRQQYGLDKSLAVQLMWYINDMSVLSTHYNTPENEQKYNYFAFFKTQQYVFVIKKPYLQRSYQSGKQVTEIISENIVGTFWLTFAAIILASFFGILLGVLASIQPDSFFDKSLVIFTSISISIPSFVLALVMAIIFGFLLHDLTGLNVTGYIWIDDPLKGEIFVPKNLILPALTLALRPTAVIAQMTRNAMLEVLSMDYIRTAEAKGLPPHLVILKHAFRNALNPIVTSISGWLASMMGGAFFVEYIFKWKGIGAITLDSVENIDYPVVMGTTIFLAFIFVIISILVDVVYHVIDPSVSLE